MKTVNEIVKEYGDYVVKDGFMYFLEKPKPKTVWDLKVGDMYWAINTDGRVYYSVWEDCKYEISMRNQGSVFLTKKESEFEKKRREVYATVKRYAYEFTKKEWNESNIKKYYPYYDYSDFSIKKDFNSYMCYSRLYFKSKEDIEKAIAAVGKDDFKKYYLDMKE